jgi:hypothetical protein
MKILELLTEGRTGSLQDDVADALPATYVFPDLQNTDPYHQYRFGMAIAAAKRLDDPDEYDVLGKQKDSFAPDSAWGENLVVVTYAQDDDTRILDLASKLMGVKKQRISTPSSQESSDVDHQSPIKPIK